MSLGPAPLPVSEHAYLGQPVRSHTRLEQTFVLAPESVLAQASFTQPKAVCPPGCLGQSPRHCSHPPGASYALRHCQACSRMNPEPGTMTGCSAATTQATSYHQSPRQMAGLLPSLPGLQRTRNDCFKAQVRCVLPLLQLPK